MTNGFYGKTITIDLSNGEKITVAAQQNDTGRYLNIAIKDKGVDYDLTGKTIRAYVIKADGNKCFVDCDIVTDDENVTNLCRMEITSQMLALNNKAIVQLKITDGENFIKSYPFEIMSNRDYTDDAAIESSNEYTALENMIKSIDSGNYNTDVKEAVSKYIADNGISAKASAITLNDNTTVEDTISSLKEDLVNDLCMIPDVLCVKNTNISNTGDAGASTTACSTLFINFKKGDKVYFENSTYKVYMSFYDSSKKFIKQSEIINEYIFEEDTIARLTIRRSDGADITINEAIENLKAERKINKTVFDYTTFKPTDYDHIYYDGSGNELSGDNIISVRVSLNEKDKININTNDYRYRIAIFDENNVFKCASGGWITGVDSIIVSSKNNYRISVAKKESSTDTLTSTDFNNAISIYKLINSNINDIIVSQNEKDSKIYIATNYGVNTENSDNTPALQALIDKVFKNGGGKIYIPNGIYRFSGVPDTDHAIKMKPNVDIFGENKSLTILKANNCDGQSYSLFHRLFGEEYPLENITINNFTADLSEMTGKTVASKAFYAQYVKHCVFRDLYLIGSPATAMGIDFLDDVVIDNVTTENCGKNVEEIKIGSSGIGIGTGGYENENFKIVNCNCVGSGQYGIFVESQKLVFGASNYEQTKGMVIANNNVRGSIKHGIGVRGVNGLTIVGNNTYENTLDGIHVEGGTNITITGNNSFLNKNNGIYLDNSVCSCEKINITGNNVNSNTTYGINIADNAKEGMSYKDIAVTSNLTNDNTEKGISLTGAIKNLYVNGNAIFDSIENNATVTGVNTVQTV